jgi:hypothetical protein
MGRFSSALFYFAGGIVRGIEVEGTEGGGGLFG